MTTTQDLITREVAVSPLNGGLVGYLVTWDFSDDGFKLMPGSTSKTLKERAGKIPVHLGHNSKGNPLDAIAYVDRGYEDDIGALVQVGFLDTPNSQMVREAAQRGQIRSMSATFGVVKGIKREDGITEVQEAKILEACLTSLPADPKAAVLAVRDATGVIEPDVTTQSDQSDNALVEPDVTTPPIEDYADLDVTLELLKLKGMK